MGGEGRGGGGLFFCLVFWFGFPIVKVPQRKKILVIARDAGAQLTPRGPLMISRDLESIDRIWESGFRVCGNR